MPERWWSSDATQVPQWLGTRLKTSVLTPVLSLSRPISVHVCWFWSRNWAKTSCFHAFSGLEGTRLNFKSAVKEVQCLAFGSFSRHRLRSRSQLKVKVVLVSDDVATSKRTALFDRFSSILHPFKTFFHLLSSCCMLALFMRGAGTVMTLGKRVGSQASISLLSSNVPCLAFSSSLLTSWALAVWAYPLRCRVMDLPRGVDTTAPWREAMKP